MATVHRCPACGAWLRFPSAAWHGGSCCGLDEEWLDQKAGRYLEAHTRSDERLSRCPRCRDVHWLAPDGANVCCCPECLPILACVLAVVAGPYVAAALGREWDAVALVTAPVAALVAWFSLRAAGHLGVALAARRLPRSSWLKGDELAEALDAGLARDHDEELLWRRMLWLEANDRFRDSTSPYADPAQALRFAREAASVRTWQATGEGRRPGAALDPDLEAALARRPRSPFELVRLFEAATPARGRPIGLADLPPRALDAPPPLPAPLGPRERENLRRLAARLDPARLVERVARAELCRELGEHAEALRLLALPEPAPEPVTSHCADPGDDRIADWTRWLGGVVASLAREGRAELVTVRRPEARKGSPGDPTPEGSSTV